MPEYLKAAEMVGDGQSFGKVDCSNEENQDLCNIKYGVSGKNSHLVMF